MHLTSELYEQVIRAIRCGPRVGHDARRLGRAGVGLIVHVIYGAKRRRLRVRVRDLSPTGIGFVSPEKIPAGERIVVELPRALADPIYVISNVRYCERISDRIHRIGALFLMDSTGTDYTPSFRACQVRNAVPG
jgi:hypothetical protein